MARGTGPFRIRDLKPGAARSDPPSQLAAPGQPAVPLLQGKLGCGTFHPDDTAPAEPVTIPYLDYQATTPCAPEVVEAMEPYWSELFANPSSRLHRPGLEAATAVEQAREQLAAQLGVTSGRLVFTSGATEANNLAIKGLAEARQHLGRHLITVATEHKAVLDTMRALERRGFSLTVLPVGRDGLLDLGDLVAAFRHDTILVSVMAANNEIGVLQPLAAIGSLCRASGVIFHCDAAQAFGHLPLVPDDLSIDLLSFSAHKFYGPKGIGALVVREGISLEPQQHGGGQEGGLRAGTLAVPLIVGMARAAALALADREEREERLGALRQRLLSGLRAIDGVAVNGSLEQRLAHNLNVRIAGVDGNRLHSLLRRRLAVSGGSACSAGSPSHVLAALGLDRAAAAASVRFGLGRATTTAEIDQAIEVVADAVRELRMPAAAMGAGTADAPAEQLRAPAAC
ncbi:cysteine desulfurase [Synechococcus sp. CS-1324]|uniref:cysteine desulfurase family protein n=1 Tax=Synechococcus sp. CS-1324 TaxID=2847980 RepID=UPI000DB49B88|nr:cysteine desulfurase family protein [Synechococcus sp. CS-1324]MCT0231370.1 cysteine desulfurase [Synechococcus sp. CS-1324]PZV00440.1 MAG: IscS subfamily cysteine desulfurase [Cyanobium sp.]